MNDLKLNKELDGPKVKTVGMNICLDIGIIMTDVKQLKLLCKRI